MIGLLFSIRLTRCWCQMTGYLSVGFFHIKIMFAREREVPKAIMSIPMPLMTFKEEIKPPPKRISSFPTASSNKVNAIRDPTKQKTLTNRNVIINTEALRSEEIEIKKESKPTMPVPPPHPTIAKRELTATEEAEKTPQQVVEQAEEDIEIVQKLNDKLLESNIIEPVKRTPDLDKSFVHKFFGSQLLVGTRMIIGNLPRKLHTLEILGKRMLIDNTQYPINEGDLENMKKVIRESR